MSKASIGVLHRLAPRRRAATPVDVACSMVALHATDPASIYLAVAARTVGDGVPVADVDRALYDDRSLARVMGMRRTMWVVEADLVPVVEAACGRAVATDQRRRLVAAIEAQGVARDGERLVADLEEQTLAVFAERGELFTAELADHVPALKATVRFGGESKWAADVALSARIVLLLSCENRIMRTRPRGSWTSTQHRYTLVADRAPMDAAHARAVLARRWSVVFGALSADPVADLKWWTGWTLGQTRQALDAADAADAADAVTGDDGDEPWAALVPALDPTTMGWKQRDWYLGDLGPQLFDRNGNAGPAVWWDGRVVGGWTQRSSGEIATRLLVDIGRDGDAAVAAEAARLQRWLDAAGVVVKPRFPTPLQKELAS